MARKEGVVGWVKNDAVRCQAIHPDRSLCPLDIKADGTTGRRRCWHDSRYTSSCREDVASFALSLKHCTHDLPRKKHLSIGPLHANVASLDITSETTVDRLQFRWFDIVH